MTLQKYRKNTKEDGLVLKYKPALKIWRRKQRFQNKNQKKRFVKLPEIKDLCTINFRINLNL